MRGFFTISINIPEKYKRIADQLLIHALLVCIRVYKIIIKFIPGVYSVLLGTQFGTLSCWKHPNSDRTLHPLQKKT